MSWKLANFARLDPTLAQRSVKGASHGSKEEVRIWEEFQDNWEQLTFESQMAGEKVSALAAEFEAKDFPVGESKEAIVRIRVNQSFFRSAILAAYQDTCCITGINLPELLSASHIVPWKVDVKNRTNPQNGLCLNALHDRAFDRGLITITDNYKVKLSKRIKRVVNTSFQKMMNEFDGADIRLPSHFLPSQEFLHYHRENIFQS